jgi:pyruvate,water dikinase
VTRGFTRALAELRREDASAYGGKSANLGELAAAGLAVPDGFAVAADAFRAFLDETGLSGTIAAAVARTHSGDVDQLAGAEKTISESMRFAPLPDAVQSEVAARYDELASAVGESQPPVAVRSSALGEDSEDATFAGQQESFLWVRGNEELLDAMRDCWASLYTLRALSYRARLGGREAAMGVTVQLMVDAERSGVMFTCNPVSGDRSMVAINASWGLGVAVVGGDVTPDDYLVSKVTGEIVRQRVNAKEIEFVPESRGRGTVRLAVPPERRDAPCLGTEHCAVLLDAAQRVEEHFRAPHDVEWAFARGAGEAEGLRVLQARPVTALPAQRAQSAQSALQLVMSTFGAAPPKDRS